MQKKVFLVTTMTLETQSWKLDAEKIDILRRRAQNANLLWRTYLNCQRRLWIKNAIKLVFKVLSSKSILPAISKLHF